MAENSKKYRAIFGVIIAAAVIVAAVFFWINPGYLQLNRSATTTSAAQNDAAGVEAFMSQVENREAWYDHRAVATWVAFCLGTHAPENLPEALRSALEPPGRSFSILTEEKPTGELTSQHLALIALSNALFLERTDSLEKLGSVSSSLERFQVSAIIIGLLTTVFISLSSTDIIKDTTSTLNGIKIAVKICAIVLPAVGTAVAALNTFYDPKSDQIRYGRISESASVLHRQIALGVASLACIAPSDKNKEDWAKNAAQIDSWMNAHKTLISPSSQKTDTAVASDSSNAQVGSPKGSQNQKPGK